MSRNRQQTQSVSLFPFLAVLVCVMGALILLLIVTSRKAKQAARVRAMESQISQVFSDTNRLPLLSIGEPSIPQIELGPSQPVIATPHDEPAFEVRSSEATEAANRAERAIDDERRQITEHLKMLVANRERELAIVQEEIRVQQRSAALVAASVDATKNELNTAKNRAEAAKLKPENELRAIERLTEQRNALEKKILELRRRLREAQAQQSEGDQQFLVVPFDGKSGTTRRPVFLECTADGLTFLPEGVKVTAKELEGFDERFNPLLAAAETLCGYWRERGMVSTRAGGDPEPYLLLLVRPEGTIAYYVAQKMLSKANTSRGYELIESEAVLKLPAKDPGAEQVCREAIEAALARRSTRPLKVSEGGSGDVARTARSSSGARGSNLSNERSGERGFELAQVVPPADPQEGRSWERLEAFRGYEEHRRNGEGRRENGRIDDERSNPGDMTSEKSEQPEWSEFNRPNARVDRGPRRLVVGPDERFESALPPSPAEPETQRLPPGANGEGSELSDGPSIPVAVPRSFSGGDSPTERRRTADDSEGRVAPQSSGEKSTRTRLSEQTRPRNSPVEGPGGSGMEATDRDAIQNPAWLGSDPQAMTARRTIAMDQLNRRKWGQYDPGATIGLEHDAVVECWADRLQVGGQTIMVEDNQPIRETSQRLLQAIDQQAMTWGKPPQGFFWTPHVEWEMHPGSDTIVTQLERELSKGGLETKRRESTDSESRKIPEANAVPSKTASPKPEEPKNRRWWPRLFSR